MAATRIPVRSSVIAAVAYDEELRDLDVEFVGGAVYRYRGVPREELARLLAADSPGRYLNIKVIPRYECIWLGG